jgi:predicted O-linked N-acetylglucosamine transferase (SPINDLY family)
MSEQIFPATLEKAAGGNLSIGELINAATALIETSQTEPARQLYKAWIDSNPKHPLLFVAHFNRSALDTQSGDTAAAI